MREKKEKEIRAECATDAQSRCCAVIVLLLCVIGVRVGTV